MPNTPISLVVDIPHPDKPTAVACDLAIALNRALVSLCGTPSVKLSPFATCALRTHDGQTVYDYSFQGRDVLVSGIVRGLPTPGGEKSLYLDDDGHILTIDAGNGLPPTARIGLGDTVRGRGTCVIETEKMGFNGTAPHITGLRIVLNDPADIRVLARPPWWTPRKLLGVIGALLLALATVCLWNITLRKVAERRSQALLTEQVARVESDLKLRERTRLSVELHDSLSQNLTCAAMEVNAARQLATADATEADRHLALASKTLKSCRDELRNCLIQRSIHELITALVNVEKLRLRRLIP